MQEKSVNPERTHNLQILLDKILPFEPTWLNLQESCVELTDFAVEHRYPGATTLPKEAKDAITHSGLIRITIREFCGLET